MPSYSSRTKISAFNVPFSVSPSNSPAACSRTQPSAPSQSITPSVSTLCRVYSAGSPSQVSVIFTSSPSSVPPKLMYQLSRAER